MLDRNHFSKTLFSAALLAVSLTFIPLGHAGKKMQGPFDVVQGAGAFVTPGLGAKQPAMLKFHPDYSVTGGGIELPIERELQTGEKVSLSNTTGGDQGEDAYLLVEQSSQGGLLIRLINHEGFNYEHCTGGDKPPPGIAHGEGPGKVCTGRGLVVTLPGEFQGRVAKINLEEGLKLSSAHAKVAYRLGADNNKRNIDADEAIQLKLAPGQSLEISTEVPAAHKFLAADGKLLFHLVEQKKVGPALGQVAMVGELRFTAKFDTGPQGDSYFIREVRAGDVIRVKGGDEASDFAASATESNNGSLLLISRIAADRPLKTIQINNESPITLHEDSGVSVTSSGGAAGYQSSGAGQQFGLPDGKTSIVQSGDTLKIELFTTVKPDGLKVKAPVAKADFSGSDDLAIPGFDPNPTDEPEADDSGTPGQSDHKDVVPGSNEMTPSGSDGGWASCSLGAAPAGVGAWDLAWLLMAVPMLRRRK